METTSVFEQDVYSVSDLNRLTRQLLDEAFPLILVSGEISNLSIPRSGHMYFSLKDETAQVRCAMFRGHNRQLDFTPQEGIQVIVRAKASLYEPRGDFQLIVFAIEETGDGVLQRKFEELKKKLANEGLFDADYKRPLPELPRCLGVVTSPTGAAIRDVLSVLQRRFPGLPVIIYPTEVQGQNAAPQIVKAIEIANQRNECDVLLVTRGGGSLEDLWPFNEEIVARAIFASNIPVVSAVGHEIDFTISDFVADVRAPTPSAAAELISPNQTEWLATLTGYFDQLVYLIQTKLNYLKLKLLSEKKRLKHPGQILLMQQQSLDYLEQNLIRIIQYRLQTERQRLASLSRTLDSVSPLNTLNRGYAIIEKNNKIITGVEEVATGNKITARLKNGQLLCTVDKTVPKD